ncbi:TonB-dependent siderophore receptor [Aliarcobacter faecis]|uniref:TonB-dependent siderophore receptor n=1 Tax=Aliarcobacter faecis TaxID=1564138 RepID=UPI00047A5865|nr:TonB-dependent siderophore receptor [Aliarcobacter faecis]QKF73238.1 TonB-dependent siderophore receptor [Aliarcobacter faecis]
MTKFKSSLIAPALAILLSTSLNAEQFSVSNLSLKEAIEEISKKSNMPYMVDGKLLDGKKAPNIKNIEGVQNALNEILKGTNLKADIEDGTILIKEVPSVKVLSNGTYVLDDVSVNSKSSKNGSAESGYLVEDITGVGIWGQRSLQDTPYSMTVISQELIENVQANDMAPIFKMNPITQDGGDQPSGNYNTVIRGFSSNNAVVNGMPLADFYSFTTMEDLERVETISGATGFLYGGGRVGGAVNYVMKKPTLEDKRSIKIGNYGGEQYYGHIDLSGQIDEKKVFGYRINALYQDGDSVENVGKEQKFVSLAFDYKPTDNFTMDLNYAHRDLKRTNQKLPFTVSSNTARPKLDVSKNYSPDYVSSEEKNDRVMTSLKWDINDIFTLRSSLLYETTDREITGDAFAYTRTDGLYNALLYRFPKGGQGFDSYAGNVYLDSKFETFGVNHLLTTGYSETYMKYKRDRNWYVGDYWIIGKTLDEIKNTIIPANPNPHGGRLAHWKTQYKNVLIGDDIVFNDQWSTLVGVNYATAISTSYDNGVKDSKYDKSELTPTLSLMYKPFEDLTTYVTYIESLEAGEPVGEDYKNEGEILDPYKSKQYEVGAKYSLNENILLTSALFRIEKSNSYEVDTIPKPTLTQDGKQIHQGIELTATGKVTDNLTIFGGGTLMDIKVEKADNPAIEGKKPTNAATKMAKLYAEYNIPMIKGLTVTGGAYYTGEKYGNRLNTDKIASYTLYDAGLRYKTKLDKYPTTFLINVSNLTGKDYWANNNFLGDPRSVAFSMKMEF